MEKEHNINEAALAYMEQKYGEEFEYVSPWGSSGANKGTVQMLVKCTTFTDEILVEVNFIESKRIFSDNYVAIKYKSETNRLLQSSLDNFFVKSFGLCNISMKTLSPNLSADATFEEYCSDTDSSISATIVIPNSIFEELSVEKFAKKFADSRMGATIRLLAVEDNIYDSLAADNIENVITQESYQYLAVLIIYDGNVQINPREVK